MSQFIVVGFVPVVLAVVNEVLQYSGLNVQAIKQMHKTAPLARKPP